MESATTLRSRSRNFVVRLRGEIFFMEEASITLSIERDKGSFERRKDRPGDNDGDPRQCQTAREAISPVPRAPRRHPKERIFLPSRARYFPFELSFLPIGRYLRGPFPSEFTARDGTLGIILLSDRPRKYGGRNCGKTNLSIRLIKREREAEVRRHLIIYTGISRTSE